MATHPARRRCARGPAVTTALLTARAVAGMLDVTPATVLRWTRTGDLPAIRLPSGQIRYRQDELDGWLGERATPNRGALTAADGAAQTQTLPSSVLAAVNTEE
jgi:excisionase family DNA binding protein